MNSGAGCKACGQPASTSSHQYQQTEASSRLHSHEAMDVACCTNRCTVVVCDDPGHFGEPSSSKMDETPCASHQCETLCDSAHGSVDPLACDLKDCSFEQLFQCCFEDSLIPCDQTCTQPHPPLWNWNNTENHCDHNFICNDYDCNLMQDDLLFHHHHHAHMPTVTSPTSTSISEGVINPNYFSLAAVTCMWGDCTLRFPDQDTLLSHIQNDHLLTSSHLPSTQSTGVENLFSHNPSSFDFSQTLLPEYHHAPSSTKTIACRWDNCSASVNVPIPIDHQQCSDCHNPFGDLSKLDTNSLLQHLMASHITSHAETPRSHSFDSLDISGTSHPSSDASTSVASPIMEHKQATHSSPTPFPIPCICRWNDCNQTFANEDELTTHLASEHIGHGKSVYECLWHDCGRRGDNAFPSKQKVMRHLQKHTGYKPHICSVCNERFAETTSLQQHMRRHTQERPYICDFPGCGKSFSIPGGLRIHKRAHSGERPFKCSEPGCTKAFAESSNLAKHMRIHTGLKPFHCDYPDCGRVFGRKDQLLRHSAMHRQTNV